MHSNVCKSKFRNNLHSWEWTSLNMSISFVVTFDGISFKMQFSHNTSYPYIHIQRNFHPSLLYTLPACGTIKKNLIFWYQLININFYYIFIPEFNISDIIIYKIYDSLFHSLQQHFHSWRNWSNSLIILDFKAIKTKNSSRNIETNTVKNNDSIH